MSGGKRFGLFVLSLIIAFFSSLILFFVFFWIIIRICPAVTSGGHKVMATGQLGLSLILSVISGVVILAMTFIVLTRKKSKKE